MFVQRDENFPDLPTDPAGGRGDTDIAAVAALIADPARTRILLALCAGEPRTATALAAAAHLSAPATSAHLGKLLAAGLLAVTPLGRHRYYRIADRQVVAALEMLARLAPTHPVRSLHQHRRARALHFARICYDHLAGTLGVRIAEALIERGAVTAGEPDALGDIGWAAGPRGGEVFAELGVPTGLLSDRQALYPCLDWSVRRPHLSGVAGAALLSALLDNGSVRRLAGQRGVRLTSAGTERLRRVLGVSLTSSPHP